MLIRLVISVADPDLRRRLEVLADEPHLHVVSAPPGADGRPTRGALENESYDIAVFDETHLRSAADLAPYAALPDRPTLVYLASDLDPEIQAGMLGEGVATILDPRAEDDALLGALQTIVERRRQERLARHEEARRAQSDGIGLVSASPALDHVLETARRVAGANSPVLILGETGVGKERLAAFVHAASPRAKGPLVAVNCAALPGELFESELFGHAKGAFTGAVRARRGQFELADRGTLFLDEVGEVPLHLQAKLLRALQEKTIRPVGADKPVPIDVRVMAATNRDLKQEVAAGRFRQDLYYRLGVIELEIPPLRERAEDILELSDAYLATYQAQLSREVDGFSDATRAALARYPWPGNVRELANVVERAVLLCRSKTIELADLPEGVAAYAEIDGAPPDPDLAVVPELPTGSVAIPDSWLDRGWKAVREALLLEGERAYLDAVLRETRGKVGLAAQRAGMSPRALFEKMRRHGLRKEDYRAP